MNSRSFSSPASSPKYSAENPRSRRSSSVGAIVSREGVKAEFGTPHHNSHLRVPAPNRSSSRHSRATENTDNPQDNAKRQSQRSSGAARSSAGRTGTDTDKSDRKRMKQRTLIALRFILRLLRLRHVSEHAMTAHERRRGMAHPAMVAYASTRFKSLKKHSHADTRLVGRNVGYADVGAQTSQQLSDIPSSYSAQPEHDRDRHASKGTIHLSIEMCPKNLNDKQVEQSLVRQLLNLKQPYILPNYRKSNLIPIGLEFLDNVCHVEISVRPVATHENKTCYTTFTQYDLRVMQRLEVKYVTAAFGFEKTSRSSVFCCLNSRPFELYFYDYYAKRIFRAVKNTSVMECCTRYLFCYCCCGTSGCGNNLTIFDGENEKMGNIQQCCCCVKSIHFQGNSRRTRTSSKMKETTAAEELNLLAKRHCCVPTDIKMFKFIAYDKHNKEIARIEQHLPKSNIFKFVDEYSKEPLGYARKSGTTKLEIEFWPGFVETEKAILIAGAILLDHLMIGISLEGSYHQPGQLEGFGEGGTRGKKCRLFYLNRLRVVIIIVFIIMALAVVAVVVFVCISIVLNGKV